MKTTRSFIVALGFFLFGTLSVQAVSTIRLIYGESWSRAGRAVKEMMASDAFKQAAGADYIIELCDESGKKANPKNLGSLKLPVIFVISDAGNCFFVKENVPYNTTPEQLLADIRTADDVRKSAEKDGLETAEACGAFLKKIEPYLATIEKERLKRIREKGYYQNVFEKLKKLDPEDKTGWVRHFTMGDGLDLVTKANSFREKQNFVGGEAFLKHIQEELPTQRLSVEQKQALQMARFALYREDANRRDEMIALLNAIADAGDETFWGTAAVGWLKLMKAPYTRSTNQKALTSKPLPGSVLRARGEGVPEFAIATLQTSETPLVATYILNRVGADCLANIAKKEGGSAFLQKFFGDTAWMEAFAGSGLATGTKDHALAPALIALDLLVWNDEKNFIDTPIGRHIATALALNHGGHFGDVKLSQIMACYRAWANNGTLHDAAWTHDVYRWRQVLAFGQNADLPVENLYWIHDFCNLDAPRYFGICWQCAYRDHNCFGDSVQGSRYYTPWAHAWNTQELRYRVGGVCGALSKFGSHAAASHGIPSFTAGQPQHCAYLLWDTANNRWGIDYTVTGHTAPHFTLGDKGFAATEEQNRYFTHPNRMAAERLRWAGAYESAMRTAPGNWQAAEDWLLQLKATKASPEAWEAYGKAVRETFATAPAQGWQLYWQYVKHLPSQQAKINAVKQGYLVLRESDAKTAEAPYFDEIALNETQKLFAKNPEALWELLPAMLDGQAQSPTFYRQTLNWAAERLMKNPTDAQKFLAIVGASAEKTGQSLDFKDMILKASKSEDPAMFKQVFALMNNLAPTLKAPAKSQKAYPTERNGGRLLSQDGMLKLSTTSGWDTPTFYQDVLTAQDFDGENGCHTAKEEAPYALVILPGASEICAVTVVNSGAWFNRARQTPLRIWVSETGTDWQEVYASDKAQDVWQCDLSTPVKAKYIKVGRAPGAKNDVFHLHKILIYGTKLY